MFTNRFIYGLLCQELTSSVLSGLAGAGGALTAPFLAGGAVFPFLSFFSFLSFFLKSLKTLSTKNKGKHKLRYQYVAGGSLTNGDSHGRHDAAIRYLHLVWLILMTGKGSNSS